MKTNGKEITKEMLEKAAQCKTAEELAALAKENGFELTIEEAEAYLAELAGNKLSGEQLDAVAGGRPIICPEYKRPEKRPEERPE